MGFIKQLLNGLQLGSIYALIAIGYTMVYGIVQLINFAHGDIIMVGGYICIMLIPILAQFGIPAWISVFGAVVLCAILGVLIEIVAYKPLRNSPRMSALITAIGVSLFLENLFMLLFSPDPRNVPQMFNVTMPSIGGFNLSFPTLITIIVSVLIMIGLQVFIKKTKIGKAMRAVSEDTDTARLMGVNVNATISITFAIGSGLAAVATVLYASAYPQIDPLMGSFIGIKAFIAAVLGGIGLIPGAMVGGIVLGVAESLAKAYISSQLADAVVYGILIIVLLVKPSGILGKNRSEKV
ncbi:MAG: branched-chain amino acid ABC transporter permease [Bacillota bacterium]|nr:branched-chain amino acid ABC transporter permease [Bacillota bacterium]